LAIGDLIAPGMLLGLALGRMGCLLHGCCWGSMCGDCGWGITFPQGSPAFMDQLETGALLGMQLESRADGHTAIVREVAPGSLAARQGFQVGEVVEVEAPTTAQVADIRRGSEDSGRALFSLTTHEGRRVSWEFRHLPPRSRPVYPTQLLSSLNAALLCWFLWAYYPFRRRDGEVLALMLTIYPITRYLLEMIRADEPGLLSSDFKVTISQALSGVVLFLVMLLWWFVLSRPRGSALATYGD
jgi:phosphatidylglycerol:prolipoprotein diacylglycerol transferase